jgi:hypothetical protein
MEKENNKYGLEQTNKDKNRPIKRRQTASTPETTEVMAVEKDHVKKCS